MKRFLWGVMIVLGGMLVNTVPATSVSSQSTAPIEVFLQPKPATENLDVYFVNGVTGLSTIVELPYFPPYLNPLEEFTLAANGIIFRDPLDGIPRFISLNGNISDIAFIPQRTTNLLRIEWVISPNGRTIAWAEIYFEQMWQADLYVAQIDGIDLRKLPPIPFTEPFYRLALLSVSNDGQRVFFDIEHPTEPRRADDLFLDYQKVMAYVAPNEVYIPLPEEPRCLCPALITNDGRVFVRLEPENFGYLVRVWNLENNFERRRVAAPDELFTQGGDLLISQGGSLLLYTLGGLEGVPPDESTSYGLMLADMTTGDQILISEVTPQRLRAVHFIDGNTAALVVDLNSGQTYKLDFATKTLTLVADGIWLGILQG